jgi:hypothetical protein
MFDVIFRTVFKSDPELLQNAFFVDKTYVYSNGKVSNQNFQLWLVEIYLYSVKVTAYLPDLLSPDL